MGCSASTEKLLRNHEISKKYSLQSNETDEEIEHCDTCKQVEHEKNEHQDGEFILDKPDIRTPAISNSSDLNELKEKINNLQGHLFCDEDFPAENDSLYYSNKLFKGEVEWKRPHELVDKPQVCVDGTNRSDMVQGILGDCWFLSACVAVSQQEALMRRIIPKGQKLSGKRYTGAIRFNFWRFGEWTTVIIDDRLPTKDGRLIYARSSNNKEFWVSLIEKAYAKLHGCYEAISGGQTMDALVDLTSGLAERYDMEEYRKNYTSLFVHLQKAAAFGALITCSRQGNWRNATKADPNGLVSGHAYTITFLKKVELKPKSKEYLVRIRNPWGDGTEWNGRWCDADSIWEDVSEGDKNVMQFKENADGEFWMSMNDFCQEFEEISICTIGPDYDGDGVADFADHMVAIKGSWVPGINAGGCRNNITKFATNPQYLLTLEETESEVIPLVSDKESLVVSLMQENRRIERHLGSRMLQIGFVIYKIKSSRKTRLKKQYFSHHREHGTSGSYINYREVIGRFNLIHGHYVVIPATFQPNFDANFMIRAYSNGKISLKELK